MATLVDRGLLFQLIQSSTSIAVVSDFLKRKHLHFSAGSWEDMFTLRLIPYLDDGSITIAELVSLLRNVEEYGRQHIFLYRTTTTIALSLLDRTAVAARLQNMSLSNLMVGPSLYDHPETPTISDVRWVVNENGVDEGLIIKEIQSRSHYRFLGEEETPTGLIKSYERERERGVNIARLHSNGILEIRIASRKGPSRYFDDLRAFRIRIRPLLPPDGFAEVSLQKAKNTLWQSKASYAGKIRFSEIAARNSDDYILKAAGGSLEANIGDNQASVDSLSSFIAAAGQCESYNLWLSKNHTPSEREIHFLISGEPHEFAINANCTQEDYEYVLSELWALNT